MSAGGSGYSAKVLDYFLNPRNVGDVENADGVGEVGAVACGDIMRISLKIRAGRIEEARFRAYGCGSAIASSSMATELIQGRSVEQARQFSSQEVAEALGGLPASKIHCTVLAEEAVKAALADYQRRQPAHAQRVS